MDAFLKGELECRCCKKLMPKEEAQQVSDLIATGTSSRTIATGLFGNTMAREYSTNYEIDEYYLCSDCYTNLMTKRAKQKRFRKFKYLAMILMCLLVFSIISAFDFETAVFTSLFTMPLTWIATSGIFDSVVNKHL